MRCVQSPLDDKVVLVEPVSYWSGKVTTVRRWSVGGAGKVVSPTATATTTTTIRGIAGTTTAAAEISRRERGHAARIDTLEYHHCRPEGFPGWSAEEYRQTLRDLYELVALTRGHRLGGVVHRTTIQGNVEYVEAVAGSDRYFHQCFDGTVREWNPQTRTTKVYEPFSCQQRNAVEFEEWFDDLHDVKDSQKRKRKEAKAREFKKRKLETIAAATAGQADGDDGRVRFKRRRE